MLRPKLPAYNLAPNDKGGYPARNEVYSLCIFVELVDIWLAILHGRLSRQNVNFVAFMLEFTLQVNERWNRMDKDEDIFAQFNRLSDNFQHYAYFVAVLRKGKFFVFLRGK